MTKVAIIGGGIIGLFSAYYLKQAGCEVVLIDRGDMTSTCSTGNAGLVVPSHVIPMASPGMIGKALSTLFKTSPIKLPFLPSMEFLRWSLQFAQKANDHHVQYAAPILAELITTSRNLYAELPLELVGQDYFQHGLLMISKNEKTGVEEAEAAEFAAQYGVNSRILDPEQTRELDPSVSSNIYNSVYYPGDHHLKPEAVVNWLRGNLKKSGTTFILNAEIADLDEPKIRYRTSEGEVGWLDYDKLIIAAGAWSNQLLKSFNIKVPLQPGKGYSFKVSVEEPPKLPSLLMDHRLSVSPLSNNTIRVTTGMEFGDYGFSINHKKMQKLFAPLDLYYPALKFEEPSHFWTGHRPCSHDGLPFIGPVSGSQNVYLATGHSMLGISLGPITGKIIADQITGNSPLINPHPFRINR